MGHHPTTLRPDAQSTVRRPFYDGLPRVSSQNAQGYYKQPGDVFIYRPFVPRIKVQVWLVQGIPAGISTIRIDDAAKEEVVPSTVEL